MLRASLLLLSALLSATTVPSAVALSISKSSIQPAGSNSSSSSVPLPNETLERIWTISRSITDTKDRLQRLDIHLPCQTFISYSDATTDATAAAIVRFAGDKSELIEAMEVATVKDHSTALALGPTTRIPKVDGSLRAEVIVYRPRLLEKVTATGSGDVVVTDNVLASNGTSAKIEAEAKGSGTIYFPADSTFQVEQLSIDVEGSGAFVLAAANITTKELDIESKGSGAVILTTKALTATKSLDIKNKGSGMLSVDAQNVATPKADLEVSGSGDVYIGSVAQCGKGSLSVKASGSLNAGSFYCAEAKVELEGSGGITLQADSVSGEATGSGTIEYLGSQPRAVALTGRVSTIVQSTKSPTQTGEKTPSVPERSVSSVTSNGDGTFASTAPSTGLPGRKPISPASTQTLAPFAAIVGLVVSMMVTIV